MRVCGVKGKVGISKSKPPTARFKVVSSSRISSIKRHNYDIILHIRPKTMTYFRKFNNKYQIKSRASIESHKNCNHTGSCMPRSMPRSMAETPKKPAISPEQSKRSKLKPSDDSTSSEDAEDSTDFGRNISYDKISESKWTSRYNYGLQKSCTPSPPDSFNNKTEDCSLQKQGKNISATPLQPLSAARWLDPLSKMLDYLKQIMVSLSRWEFVLALVVICLGIYLWPFGASFHKEQWTLKDELENLRTKYGQSDEFWLRIESNLNITNLSQDVAVFVLVYRHTHADYKVNALAREIAEIAAKFLDENGVSHEPLMVTPPDLRKPDFTVEYRQLLMKRRSMVVHNINRASGTGAKPFHFFADEYSPLVKMSAIFFTLDTNDCTRHINFDGLEDQLTLIKKTEDCLLNTWKSLPPEYLHPLVARLINVLLLVDTSKFEAKRQLEPSFGLI